MLRGAAVDDPEDINAPQLGDAVRNEPDVQVEVEAYGFGSFPKGSRLISATWS